MDEPIPSGPWHGFYLYRSDGVRHRMDLDLTFEGGSIRGSGIDDVGSFTIRGSYDDALSCRWVKAYATHLVHYAGPFDLGSIYGAWKIPPLSTGGFRIWPGRRGEGVARYVEEEAPAEAPEAVHAVGPPRPPSALSRSFPPGR